MKNKLPAIIISIVLIVASIILIVVLAMRSCKKAEDLIPTADPSASTTTAETLPDGTPVSDPSASDSNSTDGTQNTIQPAPDQTVPFETEPGEILITVPTTAANGGNNGSNTATPTPTTPTSPTQSSEDTLPTLPDGPIELPFVPADEL